ncbi:hypothetical protein GIB67_031820 [Kingdonia uniflora]|uniref:Protein-lysine N-methyltransferase GIB67_031820 n=1 Tax=Kingdonia uniflora TaxID=39325 RepID=A0A7J7L4H4_9MAGN|nr:hypothetical protein GIB67_031820 [Kingdonia uniflora]
MSSSASNATANEKKKDEGWEYGEARDPTNRNVVWCKLCNKKCTAGISRLKEHLIGGYLNVTKCPNVPVKVSKKFKDMADKVKNDTKEKTRLEEEKRKRAQDVDEESGEEEDCSGGITSRQIATCRIAVAIHMLLIARFGPGVMDTVATWTKNLCINISQGHMQDMPNEVSSEESIKQGITDLSTWSVLDLGTGNGLLLQELAKQGFSDMTGVDYSEGAIDLARNLAERDGFTNINFLVDDVLEIKLDRQFRLVMDKGTLDAIGLHPDGSLKRIMYWNSVLRLVAPGGILVITSCNNTKDELVREVENMNQRRLSASQDPETLKGQATSVDPLPVFRYISHVRSYPTFMFGGSEGSRVATVAFVRS